MHALRRDSQEKQLIPDFHDQEVVFGAEGMLGQDFYPGLPGGLSCPSRKHLKAVEDAEKEGENESEAAKDLDDLEAEID